MLWTLTSRVRVQSEHKVVFTEYIWVELKRPLQREVTTSLRSSNTDKREGQFSQCSQKS